jgi:protein-disulfide isomerase
MNRSILGLDLGLLFVGVLAAAACTAPDATMRSARDVPDEPAATKAPTAAASEKGDQAPPLADRMRSLDKTVYRVSVDDLPAMGSSAAPLTIVLFSDYECKFCRQLEPQLAQLRAEHGSDVRIVLAPKPLPFHQHAKPAALAAIAAAEQGKLEPMHRALIALDGKLDDESLTNAARDAGLDIARFDADRKGAKAEKVLAKADELAKRFSVMGTPTTFINGRRITGSVPEVVHQLGEEQLAVGRGLMKNGTPMAKVYDKLVADGLESGGPDPAVSTIRLVGGDAVTSPQVLDHIGDVTKCWSAPNAKPAKTIELTVGTDGKVTRVVTDPPEVGGCVTQAASAWTFKKADAESTLKLILQSP